MKKLSWQEIVSKANLIHNNFYTYPSQNFKNTKSKIEITCPVHGNFIQQITSHLQGCGCPKCYDVNRSVKQLSSKEEFIDKAKKIHGDKYCYDSFEYNGSNKKGVIICPVHGEFYQTPSKHINAKQGCPLCNCKIQTKDSFIKESNLVHGAKYDYSNVEYINAYTKVKIVCPKHGIFEMTPHNHLHGQGCPICKESKLEKIISNAFDENGIDYIRNANKSVLPWIDRQHLDFYLPKYNIAVECQGKQHYIDSGFFEDLDKIKRRDLIKKEKCSNNNVDLIYFSDRKYENCIFTDVKKIVDYVRNKKHI